MVRVVVIHPDLGLGGAERLIVDASRALKDKGHNVRIYTGYHDKKRCFEETQDSTLQVFVVGQWIPRTIFGRCHALMAYIKMMYIAMYLNLFSEHDLVLCDQVSACIPVLRLDFRNNSRIVFYCHFPDKLLASPERLDRILRTVTDKSRTSIIHRLYRLPIDYFEEWSTGLADLILVNSKFTESIVRKCFPSLKNKELTVLYPCVDVHKFFNCKPSLDDASDIVRQCQFKAKEAYTFLSLNRFERKKDIHLVIEALKELLKEHEFQVEPKELQLIIAGGYDKRLKESVSYYNELVKQAKDVDNFVTFIKSPTENEKLLLLKMCDAVIYTPRNEHFGIVPLEAMAMQKPVIASRSGGPMETISFDADASDRTGFCCEEEGQRSKHFARAMTELFSQDELGQRLSKAGLARVKEHFSYEAFRERLNDICRGYSLFE